MTTLERVSYRESHNMPRWSADKKDYYEVFFVKWYDVERQQVGWVRYIVVASTQRPPEVTVWAEGVGVPVRKVVHLKSAVTALPDGTVVGHLPLVDDADVWAGHFLAVPEESGAHVVLLDAHTVLMAASAPESAALFRDRGLEVVTVDISEFEKMEGCVTCLSVRLRGVPG